jgi:hypothetical protein
MNPRKFVLKKKSQTLNYLLKSNLDGEIIILISLYMMQENYVLKILKIMINLCYTSCLMGNGRFQMMELRN